ncbi:hypothetical protein [Paenibacillus prosopidis]|uniref:Uncharacterized protein n=1 Tax=Paenibacillus prosopidis TaxID=630520 RepID=A0A368VL49_9BACL|nr:hypothetical protein [Paenibacillus prosopidis]RCW42214.1 hypothetical protein DFP97_11843 [Paenibacillus prosopidis]
MQKPAYHAPKVLKHQPIRFETSQSWNKGHGPVSGDPGKSNGDNYPHEPYNPKKDKK